MVRGKEGFEVLLEEIRDKVQIIAEGHEVLRSEMKQMEKRIDAKIDTVHSSLKTEIKVTATILDAKIEETKEELGAKIDKIDKKLDEHIKQPAHV